jgi:hypothetical protein
MKLPLTVFLLAASLALVNCGKNPRDWYTQSGDDCSSGLPSAGCDYHSSGNKITLQEDPYYSSANLTGLNQWTSTDGILYQIDCACALD